MVVNSFKIVSHATASATSTHSMAPLGVEKANSSRRWSIE